MRSGGLARERADGHERRTFRMRELELPRRLSIGGHAHGINRRDWAGKADGRDVVRRDGHGDNGADPEQMHRLEYRAQQLPKLVQRIRQLFPEDKTVDEQKARHAQERDQLDAKKKRGEMDQRSAKRLVGQDIDTTGDIFKNDASTRTDKSGQSEMFSRRDDGDAADRPAEGSSPANKFSAVLRESFGLPERATPEKQSADEVLADANQRIAKDPTLPDKLISEINAQPRHIEPWEQAAIMHRVVELRKAHETAVEDVISAQERGDLKGEELASMLADELSDRRMAAMTAFEKGGTPSARSMQFRNNFMGEDYSLSTLEMGRRAARGGKQLSTDERALLKKQSDELADLTARIDTETKAQMEREFEDASKAQFADMVEQAKKEPWHGEDVKKHFPQIIPKTQELFDSTGGKNLPVKKTRSGDVVDQMASLQAVLDKINEAISKKQTPKDFARYIRALAKRAVEAGVRDRDKLIDSVHSMLKKNGVEIERPEVRDAISGYGDYRQLSKEEVDVELRRMKGELQKVAQIEALEKGMAPLKSGVEHSQLSDDARRMVKRVMPMCAADAAASFTKVTGDDSAP